MLKTMRVFQLTEAMKKMLYYKRSKSIMHPSFVRIKNSGKNLKDLWKI